MHRLHAVLMLGSVVLLLAGAGCGGSNGSAEEAATPAEAVAQIAKVKALLDTAAEQVRSGDADAAEKTVGTAYLEHFELVEGPLGERDPKLMEALEEAISTDLRNEIKDGKSAAEIETAVKEIEANLDRAEEVLRG